MKKIVSLFLTVAFIFLASCNVKQNNILSIDILNVGKADCSILFYQESVVVIDTAEEDNAHEIISYLQSKNVDKIDYLIHSHFDKDHIGGTEAILKQFDVATVIETTFPSDRAEYTKYHTVINEKEVELLQITEQYNFSVHDLHFRVSPPQKNNYDRKQDNNASLIVSVFFKEEAFLFCGDAMEERLAEFIATNENEFNFIKLPYHGNYLDNYEEFLANVNAKSGVICCSEKKPADERTLQLLNQNGVDIFQTKFGQIRVTSNGENTNVSYQ